MLIINTQTLEVSWTEFPQNDHLLSPSQQMAKTPYLFIEQLHNAADKHGKDAKFKLTQTVKTDKGCRLKAGMIGTVKVGFEKTLFLPERRTPQTPMAGYLITTHSEPLKPETILPFEFVGFTNPYFEWDGEDRSFLFPGSSKMVKSNPTLSPGKNKRRRVIQLSLF